MRPDPAQEWQRLTRLYAEMTDGQLEELAETYSDLTETAQPILRDEMKKRGLDDPQILDRSLAPSGTSSRRPNFTGIAPRFSASDLDPDEVDEEEDGSGEPHHEYTWKTELCESGSSEEAWQIRETLRVAGIDTWESRPSSMFGSQTIRIMVAADQLDEARAILAKPIPQEIVDQSKEKPEDFVPPACPKCGAPDPLLESVEPVNTWSCEICNATWTDSTAFGGANSRANS